MNNIKNANLYPRNTVAKAYINMPINHFVYHNYSLFILLNCVTLALANTLSFYGYYL